MSNETIIVGNQYKVVHDRKGTFGMLVTNISQGGEWIHGVVKGGVARATLPYKEKFEGDKITIRASFCSLTPLEEKEAI
ncbi:MAG: hypothetical protein NWE89_12300 [Candidatus Bathyarchaeota archaeon]|nr:hypothetical protein [Candidatus Bathyarchaeota archaeon]